MDDLRLAVIPARGGSKRIPRKNVKDFNGRPLIAYSVTAALESGLFDKVIVSTDDLEIAAVAERYGALAPFLRDEALADDFTGTEAVTRDAMLRMRDLGFDPGCVCCIYATAPLLTAAYLRRAHALFEEREADCVYACCEFSFPVQRGCYLDPDGRAEPFMPECMPMRSQDLRPVYQDAGLFYFYKPAFLENGGAAARKTYGFIMPRYRVIDIDTPEDFTFAQVLARTVGQMGLK